MKKKFSLQHMVSTRVNFSGLSEKYVWIEEKPSRFFGLIKAKPAYLRNTYQPLLDSNDISVKDIDTKKYITIEDKGVITVVVKAYVVQSFSDRSNLTTYFERNELALAYYEEIMEKPFTEHVD